MNHRRRIRRLLRVLVRAPGCLVLASGLVLGAAGNGSAAEVGPDAAPSRTTLTPAVGERGGPVLDGQVLPVDTQVEEAENGDFTISVTNTGTVTADNVRVLLDEASEDNPVGSPDGRCLSRLDSFSPADLWCEMGDVEPMRTVSVRVHAYMNECVWLDPLSVAQRAPAFRWRVGYTDGGRALSVAGPTPRWSCSL